MAAVYSPAVRPVWAHAVRPDTSIWRSFISDEVEHDATICGAVTGEAVASALDGKLEPILSRKGDDLRDV